MDQSQFFKGTYVFKQSGLEIGRSENLITTNGRKILLQYLAGVKSDWASDLCIGALNTSVSSADIELNFETARVPVTLKTYQSATGSNPDLIVVRGTLPENLYANIYEVGLYPEHRSTDVSNRSNQIITDFSDLTNWYASVNNNTQNISNQGTVYLTGFMPQAAASPRIGGFSIGMAPNTLYTNNTFNFSLLGYTNVDTLQILAYNTVSGNLTITMVDNYNNSYVFTYTLQNNSNYQSLNVNMPSNIYNSNQITSISIATDNTSSLTIDAIKTSVTQELSSTDYIISKSLLTTPIAKIYGTPLDIEYYVQVL